MGQSSNPAPVLILAMMAVLVVSGVAAYLLLAGAPAIEPGSERGEVVASGPLSRATSSSSRSADPSRAGATSGAPAGSAKSDGPDQAERARARVARDLERERIWSALRKQHELEPEAPGSPVPDPTQIGRLPELDKEYIRSAIKEQLVPVAVDCYNSALQDDPELGGRLVLDFVIVGAEDVGGVVEESEINEESDLDSPFLRECLRESMMAVTFDAPPGGGRVEVTYPLDFSVE